MSPDGGMPLFGVVARHSGLSRATSPSGESRSRRQGVCLGVRRWKPCPGRHHLEEVISHHTRGGRGWGPDNLDGGDPRGSGIRRACQKHLPQPEAYGNRSLHSFVRDDAGNSELEARGCGVECLARQCRSRDDVSAGHTEVASAPARGMKCPRRSRSPHPTMPSGGEIAV
jgi:hypothetical protein